MENFSTELHLNNKKRRFSAWFTKKRTIWTVIIILILGGVGYAIFRPKDNSKNIQTETAKKQQLKSTVLATGQVVSKVDLVLSFKASGITQSVNVKEGDKVKAGQTLAALEQKDALASLTQARGALAQAQANYNKVLAGASNEEIAVAQKALDSAQVALDTAKTNLTTTVQQQETAVKNAYSALLNTSFAAVASTANVGSATVTVNGAYAGPDQGVYKIYVYNTGAGQKFQSSGLETADGDVRTTPVALGNKGLFLQFSGAAYNNDSWTITIPNTLASIYVTNYNAYLAAQKTRDSAVSSASSQVDSATAALAQAKASLDLKRAQARPADLDAAKAQILSAQGQVEAVAAVLDNQAIHAPADGTITLVDIKPGELATALKQVIVLQDINDLHVEANVSEADIADIKPGQIVDITFDAFGSDRYFSGQVQTVNPGATVVSGVVNYKVTIALQNAAQAKPGMTANTTVLIEQKDNVLAIPLRAIINKQDAPTSAHDLTTVRKFVRVIDDSKKKTYHEAEVQTGMQADGGLVEITGGLSEGQEVVTFIKH